MDQEDPGGSFSGLRRPRSKLSAFLLFLALASPLPADTFTWDGGGADNGWKTNANWVGDVAPGSSQDLVFTGNVQTNTDAQVSAIYHSITFDAEAQTFTLNGSISVALTIETQIANLAAKAHQLNFLDFIVFGGPSNTISNVAGGSMTFAEGEIFLRELTIDGEGDTIIHSRMGNNIYPGSVIKNGSGTLTLSHANTYSGGTTITEGTLLATGSDALGTGAASVESGGSLQLISGVTLANALTLSGTGTGVGSGALVGEVTAEDGVATFAGEITLGSDATILATSGGFSGGRLDLNGRINTAGYDLSLTSDSGTPTGIVVSGAIEGSGGLKVTGLNIILQGSEPNTFSGGTEINGGTVRTEKTQALGSGDVTLRDAAILNPATDLTIGGNFLWEGGVIEQVLGTDSTAIHITGALDNSEGGSVFSLSMGTGFAINTSYTLLTFGDGSQFSTDTLEANSLNGITPDFRLINAGNTLQVIYLGATTGPLLQNSGDVYTPVDETFTVDGAVETGTATESNKVLSLAFADDGGSLVVHNTLTLGTGGITTGSGNASIVDGTLESAIGFHIDTAGGELTISSRLSAGESDDLRKTGEGVLRLLGDNTFGGDVLIAAGTIAVSADGNLGIGGNIHLDDSTLRAEGTFLTLRKAWLWPGGGTLEVASGQTLTWDGEVADSDVGIGAGTLTKTGPGTLVLTQSNSYSGGTVIHEGSVRTQNSNALGSGAVSLNAGADLAPTGNLTLSSFTWNGGTLSLSLGNVDRLTITGDFTKGSGDAFLFDLANDGFGINQTYTLLTFGNNDGFSLSDFSASAFYGTTAVFAFEGNSLTLQYTGAVSGPVLQNSGPVFTPVDANFLVSGAVTTQGPLENNTVNSLLFENKSSLEVSKTLTITSGNFTVINGSAALTGSKVVTPGDFRKLGSGMLVTSLNLDINGGATIEEGGLIVNGRFATTHGLTLSQATFLGGSGVIDGNVVNHGRLNPGNSPGTLTLLDDYTQAADGDLAIEIASLDSFDRLQVGGTASLAGLLDVIPYGAPSFAYGDEFTFLKAGKVTGEFNRMNTPTGDRWRLIYEPQKVSLLVAPTSYTLLAQTPNQRSVAAALDHYISATGDDRETVSIALDRLRADDYPDALNQIAPTFYESLGRITVEQSHSQGQMLQQRLGAVRLGYRGFSQVGLDAPVVAQNTSPSYIGKDIREVHDIMEPVADNPWGVWIAGNGLFAKASSLNNVPNYRFDSGGFLLGADYHWSDQFATGLYAGYQGTRARYDDGSRTDIDAARFGAYATFDSGNGFYSNGILGGGYSS